VRFRATVTAPGGGEPHEFAAGEGLTMTPSPETVGLWVGRVQHRSGRMPGAYRGFDPEDPRQVADAADFLRWKGWRVEVHEDTVPLLPKPPGFDRRPEAERPAGEGFTLAELGQSHLAGELAAERVAAARAELAQPAANLAKAHPIGPPPKRNRKTYPYQGTITYAGIIPIRVENRAGSMRRGVDGDGRKWATKMHDHYGEVVGTLGVDGDPVDVFVGPLEHAPWAYVVHATDPRTGRYDECKIMMGYGTKREAAAAFRGHYDGPGFYGAIRKVALTELLAWLRDPKNRGQKVTAGSALSKGCEVESPGEGRAARAERAQKRAHTQAAPKRGEG
jgi:hypothetical protein